MGCSSPIARKRQKRSARAGLGARRGENRRIGVQGDEKPNSIAGYLRRHHLGLIAIFIALTGTAAALPGKNKVDSGDIKAGQVKGSDLANNSVTSPKVADGSLLAEDFAAGELPAGPQGETGPPGPPNPNAEMLDGLDSTAFAPTGHNHDGAYVNEGQVNSVSAGMIVNPTRAISIPLLSFANCTTLDEHLNFNIAAAGKPEFIGSGSDGGPLTLRWRANDEAPLHART